jgi:hypothetical protein
VEPKNEWIDGRGKSFKWEPRIRWNFAPHATPEQKAKIKAEVRELIDCEDWSDPIVVPEPKKVRSADVVSFLDYGLTVEEMRYWLERDR